MVYFGLAGYRRCQYLIIHHIGNCVGMVVSSLGAPLDIGVPQGTSTQCMVVYNVKGYQYLISNLYIVNVYLSNCHVWLCFYNVN